MQTNEPTLARRSGEELLLIAITGNRRTRQLVDQELAVRAFLAGQARSRTHRPQPRTSRFSRAA